MIILPISLTEKQYAQLKQEKEIIGSSMASTIRMALDTYFRNR